MTDTVAKAGRCWLLHDWSKWREVSTKALWSPFSGAAPIPITRMKQERTCERCGFIERRTIDNDF